MTTFGAMKTRIATEFDRSGDAGFVALIGQHINDAIQLNRAAGWWFLEGPTSGSYTSTTTAGNQYVARYPGLQRLDSLLITLSGQPEPLIAAEWTTMEQWHASANLAGDPSHYALYGNRVRLYPTPGSALTLTWSGTFDEPALSVDADSNDWMTHGAPMIRAYAMMTLYRDVMRDDAGEASAGRAVVIAKQALDRETAKRASTRRIKPRW